MAAKSVVVTGASTGIGRGIVEGLLHKQFSVFGTVRKQADADRLRSELGTGFTPLLMDVTDQAAVLRAADQVRRSLGGSTLAGLVNNAGIAVVGPLLHQPLTEFRRQLEVNLTAPLLVTQAFADMLGTDRTRAGAPGRIINISSVGGKMGAPFLGAYAASKHGLEGMSESLRRELMLYGIDVILIEPGYVNTPILDKAEAEDFGIYAGTDYGPILERFAKFFVAEGRKGLAPAAIGDAVHKALTVRKPRVVYTVVKQKFKNWTLPMQLPKRVLDRLIAKQLGLGSQR
ncbi:MAG: SDR family oxidoreductase [Acidobacteriota bacterium]|nr:SDR family oxidoreductase [Acidobacteriota bacterium]